MLYWLSLFSDQFNILNLFRYLTVRTGGAMVTAGVFVFLCGPWIIDHLRLKQGKGQPIRTDGPVAPGDQERHADHGRADDPARDPGVDAVMGQPRQCLCVDRAGGDALLWGGRLL